MLQEVFNGLGIKWDVSALSLEHILQVLILLLGGMVVIRILMKLVNRMLERSSALASLRVYISSVVKVLLWFLLALMVAEALNFPTTSLIALLSVAGLAVSLALQNTLSNLAGGITLLVTKPFQVGDYVEANGISGTVQATDLSYTTIATVDNKRIFIPNSELSGTKIVNYNAMGQRRVDLNFTASYEAPTQTVKQAIREVLDTIPQIQNEPAPPAIWLSEYQASSIQYVVRVWTASSDYWDVYYAIQEGVRESFARHGVEMTYDHLNVHILDK